MLSEVLALLDLGDPQIQIHRELEERRRRRADGEGGFGAELSRIVGRGREEEEEE